MKNNKLIDFLRGILGSYKSYSGEEYYFQCPFCTKRDNKKKLAVKLDNDDKEHFQRWHCWRDDSHRGNTLLSLVHRMRLPDGKSEQLKEILKSYGINLDINNLEKELYSNPDVVKKAYAMLPDGFHSFVDVCNTPEYRNALLYIKGRNITGADIIKHNIGYCESGRYQGYIIIPSYDDQMNLNYFVARSYYGHDLKYKNPPMDKNAIIFNELHINWNLPIVLCEGVFDALAIKRNAIPLLGKTVNDTLREKIFERKVQEIYLCLDLDALKNTVRYIEEFLRNGITVYFVELPQKDPSEIGFAHMSQFIKSAKKMDFTDLIKLKMSL